MPRHFDELELSVLKSLGVGPNDPAADAMLNRIAEIKDLELGGDPAFQAGSQFFKSRFGGKVESALSQFGQEASDGDDLTACLVNNDAEACARVFGGGDGDGAGGAGGSFSSSQAGLEAQNAFDAAEADKARQFEREQEIERLKAERERIFVDMLGTDPVRAVLFALGVGGEILPGGDRFADLAPLPGAQAQATATEQALSQLVGGGVKVGQAGVTGLGTAAKAAAAFGGQAGGAGGNVADQQKLLLSGFGVGAKRGKGRPGQSREETLRQIASVTPTGIL